MTWKPVSTSELDADVPASTLWAKRSMDNAAEVVSAGRCHVFSWPMRYNDELSSDYEGLAIHTSPYTWRGIPLHIPRSNINGRISVHVWAKTVPSFYSATSEFGGEVDLWLDVGGNPPSNSAWADDPNLDGVGFTSFSRRIESTDADYSLTTLFSDVPPFTDYQTLDGQQTSTVTLWVRSRLSDEVSIPAPLVIGTPVDEFYGYRRSAMELPFSFSTQAEKIQLTGRVLQKSRRPVSLFFGDMAMHPYPDYYFVEGEFLYDETRDPLKPNETFYGAFTFPPFPSEVLDLIITRNRQGWEASQTPTEFVEAVYETTGLRIASITVEEHE